MKIDFKVGDIVDEVLLRDEGFIKKGAVIREKGIVIFIEGIDEDEFYGKYIVKYGRGIKSYVGIYNKNGEHVMYKIVKHEKPEFKLKFGTIFKARSGDTFMVYSYRVSEKNEECFVAMCKENLFTLVEFNKNGQDICKNNNGINDCVEIIKDGID